MILVALGANLPSPVHGGPITTLTAALAEMNRKGVEILKASRWYETAPVPVSDQPWYVNAVAAVATDMAPAVLLTRLHEIEATFGRVRSALNAPRVLDLDLLSYEGLRSGDWPLLPHPRLQDRAFVLLPLRDVAPGWRHPVTGEAISTMLARIGPEQQTRLLEPPAGQL
jgi:2-amino-4-hydroxy-6-hydroxymethyldihydropteridine diphosphokinase